MGNGAVRYEPHRLSFWYRGSASVPLRAALPSHMLLRCQLRKKRSAWSTSRCLWVPFKPRHLL